MAFNQVASATSAAANNYRFDTIELTVTGATGASGDAADLTNIVQFGMPIELSANGQTRGYLPNVGGAPTGQSIVDAMKILSPTACRMAPGKAAARRCHRRPTIAKPTWAATMATAPVAATC